MRLRHREPRPARPLALAGRAQIGTDVEEIVLDARERGIERGVIAGMEARDPERGIGLVERAIGGDAQVVFLAPFAAAERGGAVIPGAGVDLVEDDHELPRQNSPASYRAMTQTVNMITTMATNCSSTRNRISFCEVLPDPPRIILTRPRNSTTTTAPIAIGRRA